MKAIVYTKYGSPDVLELRDMEKPLPTDEQVLVNVYAAAANPADWHMIRGKPLFARLSFGLFKPKNTIPGLDIAGRVEAVGKNVADFKPGDSVFGDSGGGGGFAEYVCVAEKNLVLKPENLTFEQAAAVNVAAITALQGLRFKGPIKPNQNVLINGASGGVGTFAVQIATSFGAKVTGVCSTRNVEMVRSIGADDVIDYTKKDFTTGERKYDFILDAVGNRSVGDYRRALTKDGHCVIAGFTTLGRLFQHMMWGALSSSKTGKSVGLMGTAQPNKKDFTVLKELLESNKIQPVIDRTYPLNETAEAIRYLETGHARGKVVIIVQTTNEE